MLTFYISGCFDMKIRFGWVQNQILNVALFWRDFSTDACLWGGGGADAGRGGGKALIVHGRPIKQFVVFGTKFDI